MSKALLTDLGSGKTYLIDENATIGRSSDNDIILNDDAVSGNHASITSTGSAWYISDSGSKNGIEMNNFRVPSEGKLGLRNGCQLKLGNTLLRFTTDTDAIDQFLVSQNRAKTRQNNQSGSGVVASNTNGKRKNKGVIFTIISVAAVLVLVLSWCLINHSNGSKRMAEGNYAAAVSSYKKDFLFSGTQRTEATLLAGEAAYSAQDYYGAIDFFAAAGSAGKERWADAVYEQALVLIKNSEPDNAIKLLNQISNETRAQEQIGVASLLKAQQQYSAGDVDAAIQTAQGIQNTKYADVTAFLDMVYHSTGSELFAAEDYQGAKEAYEKCEKDPVAKTNAETLRRLIAKDYYQAAILANTSIINGNTDLSRKQWTDAFESFIGTPNLTDINKALAGEAAKAVVAGNSVFESSTVRNSFNIKAPSGSMIGSYKSSSEYEFVISNLNSLYDQCGKNPSGKILIIAQRHTYSDRTTSQAILWNLMRLLPGEYYPSSLDEVEYLVLVDYDYRKEGRYMFVTVALQEYAEVSVLRATDLQQLYISQRVDGNSAPSSFSYYGSPPAWKSGNAPNMGEEIHSAISSIIE